MLLIDKFILLIPTQVLAGSLQKGYVDTLTKLATYALDEDHKINRKQAEGSDINSALKTTDQ